MHKTTETSRTIQNITSLSFSPIVAPLVFDCAEIIGIEGGFYPNFCSDAKNAPKSTKEFYPTHRIETKSKPSENRQTGDWDPQNGPDYIKMLA